MQIARVPTSGESPGKKQKLRLLHRRVIGRNTVSCSHARVSIRKNGISSLVTFMRNPPSSCEAQEDATRSGVFSCVDDQLLSILKMLEAVVALLTSTESEQSNWQDTRKLAAIISVKFFSPAIKSSAYMDTRERSFAIKRVTTLASFNSLIMV